MVDLAELTSHGGLARTRVAGEDGVIGDIARGGQPPAPTLQEEAGVVGHRGDALLHLAEPHHRIELVHTLLVGIGSASKDAEIHILHRYERQLAEVELRQSPLHIARPYLLFYDAVDVGERPVRERSLTIAPTDGTDYAVFQLCRRLEILLLHLVEERLHQLKLGIGFLFYPAVTTEHLLHGRELVEQSLNFLSCTTEPEGTGDSDRHHLA